MVNENLYYTRSSGSVYKHNLSLSGFKLEDIKKTDSFVSLVDRENYAVLVNIDKIQDMSVNLTVEGVGRGNGQYMLYITFSDNTVVPCLDGDYEEVKTALKHFLGKIRNRIPLDVYADICFNVL